MGYVFYSKWHRNSVKNWNWNQHFQWEIDLFWKKTATIRKKRYNTQTFSMGFQRAIMGECSLFEMTSKFGQKLELEPTFPKKNRSVLKTASFFRKKKIQYANEANGLSESNDGPMFFTWNDIEIWSKIGIGSNISKEKSIHFENSNIFFFKKKIQYGYVINGLSKSYDGRMFFDWNDIKIGSEIGIGANIFQREMDPNLEKKGKFHYDKRRPTNSDWRATKVSRGRDGDGNPSPPIGHADTDGQSASPDSDGLRWRNSRRRPTTADLRRLHRSKPPWKSTIPVRSPRSIELRPGSIR